MGGTVPATPAHSLGAPASFGAFTPGSGQDYSASSTADALSTAGGAFAAVSADPLALLSWIAPVSHDPVTIALRQTIGANDALRTGSYSKTLTFTLSTTTP